MSSPSVRTVLPLALVTGTSMLAMDLFLPAVPTLQAALGIGVTQAQATVALFLAGLAASQLLWGEALNRLGPRRCVLLGVGGLLATSVGCALAPDIGTLLVLRTLQGVAAGAATVVAPSVVRATLDDADAVRGLATIASIEAVVPAAGPVFGTALLAWTDWRGTFWVLAAVTLVALPFVVRVTPHRLPGLDLSVPARYRDILGNGRFARLAVSHALCFGGLLSFVASAPQLLQHALARGPSAFVVLQVAGVTSFMAVASQSGRISRRLGPARAVQLGGLLHCALCGALLLGSLVAAPPFAALLVFWCGYCGTLAVRGPAAFSEALQLPPAQMGRASAMLVLALLLASAAATQGIAPFVDGPSLAPLAALMLAMNALSLALVLPYPRPREPPSP